MKPDMKTRHLSENQTIDSHGHLSRNGPLQPPKNSTTVMAETSTMPTYSPTKNMPNFMPEYSVWKPAASSDSASGRSNGVRCTTAIASSTKVPKPKHCGTMYQPCAACPTTIKRKND